MNDNPYAWLEIGLGGLVGMFLRLRAEYGPCKCPPQTLTALKGHLNQLAKIVQEEMEGQCPNARLPDSLASQRTPPQALRSAPPNTNARRCWIERRR